MMATNSWLFRMVFCQQNEGKTNYPLCLYLNKKFGHILYVCTCLSSHLATTRWWCFMSSAHTRSVLTLLSTLFFCRYHFSSHPMSSHSHWFPYSTLVCSLDFGIVRPVVKCRQSRGEGRNESLGWLCLLY